MTAMSQVQFSLSPVNEMEFNMSRMKSILQSIIEAQEAGLLPDAPNPTPKAPQVYIMTCNGKPVAAYVDQQTAKYEAYLCTRSEEHTSELQSHLNPRMPSSA